MHDIDYSNMETASAEPDPCSMIETFRAIGYSIETAVADIVDNSIAAKATSVWIDYEWKGPDTVFSITDNGSGMSNDEIILALKPGCKNPLDRREEGDLGRFGLGLKTASFSQTRKFSVFSAQKGDSPSYWSWDMDFVNSTGKWTLVKYCPEHNNWLERVGKLGSGTSVVWWELDRLTADTKEASEASKKKFLSAMDRVKSHLSMVFHRFIESGLSIYFKERKIKAWDPFMIGCDALQSKPETRLHDGKVTIKGFVLPHRSKLDPDKYEYGKGPKDSWTAHQGFYVYRGGRLLVPGDWLGFFKKEVHYDLCRIQIHLSNDMDEEWQIDIKKSIARPPLKYRENILAVAKDVRNQAVEVYRHKGKVLKRQLSPEHFSHLWQERARHGKRFYKVNRSHPLVEEVLTKSGDLKKDIEHMLQFIEETIPVPLITLQENESEKQFAQPFEGKDCDPVKELMSQMFTDLLKRGKSDEQAKAHILNIEPFNYYPQFIEHLGGDK